MLSCNSTNVLSGQFQRSSCPFLPHTSKSTNFIANSETLNGHIMVNDELDRFSSGRVFCLLRIFNGSDPLFYFSICTILVYRFNRKIYSSELEIFVGCTKGSSEADHNENIFPLANGLHKFALVRKSRIRLYCSSRLLNACFFSFLSCTTDIRSVHRFQPPTTNFDTMQSA